MRPAATVLTAAGLIQPESEWWAEETHGLRCEQWTERIFVWKMTLRRSLLSVWTGGVMEQLLKTILLLLSVWNQVV